MMARRTSNAVEILMHHIKDDPEMLRMMQEAEWQCIVAQAVYDARIVAGLSHKELADRIGVEESVIVQIEDSDYEEPMIPILQRMAECLHCRMELKFIPIQKLEAAQIAQG